MSWVFRVPPLSHAIIGLEAKLGVRLFNRTTRSVSLTQAGARLLGRVNPLLQDLDQALDTLSEERGTPSGTLRINANKSGARILLADVVPRFLDLYPDVELDLVSEGRLVDIVEQGFDAGIRLLEAVPKDMIAVRLAAMCVSSPSQRHLIWTARPNRKHPMIFISIAASANVCRAASAIAGSFPDAAPKSLSTCLATSPSMTVIFSCRRRRTAAVLLMCRNISRGRSSDRAGW